MSGPWGIAVTGTLHLPEAGGLDPSCRDQRVQLIVDGLRRRYRSGDRDAPPIFGYADGRPVCRRCIRATERRIRFLRAALAEVNDYERSRL